MLTMKEGNIFECSEVQDLHVDTTAHSTIDLV